MATNGEQIRRWLIDHDSVMIAFNERGFIKRTLKATEEEWEILYKLLGEAENKEETPRFIGESPSAI